MRQIVYYVATSIDGYISGPNDDISGFLQHGKGVDKYLSDLSEFDTVIMGRNTYEFGYKFGIKPGQSVYLNMTHYIFSNSLKFDNQDKSVHVKKLETNHIREIKNQEGTDIYLSGGGQFAGWLLDNELIDILKIKLNPLILGKGVRLFGNSTKEVKTIFLSTENYDDTMQIMSFKIKY